MDAFYCKKIYLLTTSVNAKYDPEHIMDGWMEGWMDGWMEGGMDGWKDGWMDRWMDGWMDGWMEERLDGFIGLCAVIKNFNSTFFSTKRNRCCSQFIINAWMNGL